MSVSFFKMKLSQVLTKPGFYVLIGAIVSEYLNLIGDSFIWFVALYIMLILNRKMNVTEKELELDAFDPKIPEIIDNLIMESLNLYVIFNIGPDKKYISEKDEPKIVNEVIERVLFRLSKPMLIKLKAYYNEEMVESIITEKIYMAVTDYIIMNNKLEEDDLPSLNMDTTDSKMVNIL